MSLAQQIAALQQDRDDIYAAIQAKGGAVNPGDGFDDFAAAIGTISEAFDFPSYEKDVNFYDFDGTLLFAYSIAEANALTALPAPPRRAGLEFDGWNWSLQEVQSLDHVANIGAFRVTSDDKTAIIVRVTNDTEKSVSLRVVNGTVEWGDGASTSGVNVSHEYSAHGEYVIRITHTSAYTAHVHAEGKGVRAMFLSKYVEETSVGGYWLETFAYAHDTEVTLFQYANCLKALVLNATWRNSYGNIEMPSHMHSTKVICFPKSITQLNGVVIKSGTYGRLVLPDGITKVAFSGTYNDDIFFASELYIPEGLEEMKWATTIDRFILFRGNALRLVKFPSTLQSIICKDLFDYYSRAVLDFTALNAVPSLDASSPSVSSYGSGKILVPSSLLSAWRQASVWSTYASIITDTL